MSMKEIGLGKALAMTYRAGRMTPGERKELAQKRLKELAVYAGQNSPYYGRLYKELPEDWKLTDLPTVNKVDLMAHFDMWLTDRTVTEEAVNSFMEDRETLGGLWMENILSLLPQAQQAARWWYSTTKPA